MKTPPPKLARCAIYTRKSTEHNLDLEFNSLDAQREACEAYIKSQTHEGWRLIPDAYDDGGLSGASLNRPALQALLTDIAAGKIDVVVVYKVDRLTRALGDFAKLVELFDRHAVSFVSVTQSFNTTTSMGRLTLNVLLSFAQFEREVIGERVRDKISASKKKGIWVGGPIPLGYASVAKKLVLVPEHAETVRTIFQRYLDLGSLGALAQDLDRSGLRTKLQHLSNDKTRGGAPFGIGALAHLLKNRFYVGDVAYRGEIHRGDHPPIVERTVFDAVQAKLAGNAVDRQLRLKGSSAILRGRIYDDRGNRMSPSHNNKDGARYRYYVSQAILKKRPDDMGSVGRVSAPDIERIVVEALRKHISNPKQTDPPLPASDREVIERHADHIVIKPDAIEIYLAAQDSEILPDENRQASKRQSESDAKPKITLPWTAPSFTAKKGIVHAPGERASLSPETRDALLLAIAKARGWVSELAGGHMDSLADIAKREGKVERHIRLLAPLAFVSPRIVTTIIDGSAPADMTVTDLAYALSFSWTKQRQ